MARGNDASAAALDLNTAFGTHGNAEELIQAHQQAQDREVIRASLGGIDAAATAELDLDKLEFDGPGKVVSASVRGTTGVVVAVVEGKDGQLRKVVATEKSGRSSTSSKSKAAKDQSDGGDEGQGEKTGADTTPPGDPAEASGPKRR